MIAVGNPYYNTEIVGFFSRLFWRLLAFSKGDIAIKDFAPDEVQMLVLVGIAISGALVGTFLVLRRMTMLANGLSHTILLGIVVAFVLTRSYTDGDHEGELALNVPALLLASVGMGLITTFLTNFMTEVLGLQRDASIGVVFTSLFALGVIAVTVLTRSAHIGTEAVMGNVDALHADDLKLVFTILACNMALFVLFFKEYQLTTFDPEFANAMGISTTAFSYLLMVQVSGTAIGGFRAVGVLMILAFMTGPVLAARLLTDDLRRMLVIAAALGSLASILGVAIARHVLSVYGIALSTAGVVVCVIVVIFTVIAIVTQVQAYKAANALGDNGAA